MIHIFQNSLKRFIHNKQQMFWILVFPIVLGLFFKLAFSGIASSDIFTSIPVAVIGENTEELSAFKSICSEIKNNDELLLNPDFNLSEDEALNKLESNDIYGIIYVGEQLKLKVNANTGDDNTNQSILSSFVGQYNASTSIINDIAQNHPDKIAGVAKVLNRDTVINEEHKFVSNNSDVFTQYFYNLLAMACLYTALVGFEIAIQNQGNLSVLGARRNVSPTNKLKIIVGELAAAILFNYALNMIAFAYIIFVLKIDLTFHLPFAILAMLISTITGVSYGFFIGSILSKKRGIKEAVLLSTIMFGCFLSGLMVGSMRIIVEQVCPIVNRINPAALISDSLYSLANYENLGRYYTDILTLCVLAILFTLGGFLFTRRKKYASL